MKIKYWYKQLGEVTDGLGKLVGSRRLETSSKEKKICIETENVDNTFEDVFCKEEIGTITKRECRAKIFFR